MIRYLIVFDATDHEGRQGVGNAVVGIPPITEESHIRSLEAGILKVNPKFKSVVITNFIVMAILAPVESEPQS